jgi:hypothetical protein
VIDSFLLIFWVRDQVVLYQHPVDAQKLDLLDEWVLDDVIRQFNVVAVLDECVQWLDANRISSELDEIFRFLDLLD